MYSVGRGQKYVQNNSALLEQAIHLNPQILSYHKIQSVVVVVCVCVCIFVCLCVCVFVCLNICIYLIVCA